MTDRTFRVLSIDGGGVRGYLPALVLAELERRAGRPVGDLFDLIVGTSTGGIIGIGGGSSGPAGMRWPTRRATCCGATSPAPPPPHRPSFHR